MSEKFTPEPDQQGEVRIGERIVINNDKRWRVYLNWCRWYVDDGSGYEFGAFISEQKALDFIKEYDAIGRVIEAADFITLEPGQQVEPK